KEVQALPRFPGVPGLFGFWRALAEVDPQAIALQAIENVSIAIVGPPEAGKETLRRALLGETPGAGADQRGSPGAVQVVEALPGAGDGADPARHARGGRPAADHRLGQGERAVLARLGAAGQHPRHRHADRARRRHARADLEPGPARLQAGRAARPRARLEGP